MARIIVEAMHACTAAAPWLSFSDDVTERTGSVKVRAQFGLQRGKITGRISCDAGMDKNAVLFALNRAFDIVKERSGHDLENVTLKTFEMNRDVHGIRLDGFKCYTKKGLFGMIERIYQKEEDVVRHEHKITAPMTLDEFEILMRGGVTGYNLQQAAYAIIQEQRKSQEIQKFANRELLDARKEREELKELVLSNQKNGQAHQEPMQEYIDVYVDGKRGSFNRSERKTVID